MSVAAALRLATRARRPRVDSRPQRSLLGSTILLAIDGARLAVDRTNRHHACLAAARHLARCWARRPTRRGARAAGADRYPACRARCSPCSSAQASRMAGAMMQGLFRNPLADPGLIGVSSGAALAAVATIALGNGIAAPLLQPLGIYALPVAAFFGGMVTTGILVACRRAARPAHGRNAAAGRHCARRAVRRA